MKSGTSLRIVMDVDDCLLQFLAGLKSWLRKKGYQIPVHDPFDWKLHGYVGVSEQKMSDLMHEFHLSETYGKLPPMPFSRTTVQFLKDNGAELFLCTACGLNPEVQAARVHNLKMVYGDVFEDIIMVKSGKDKKPFLEKLFVPGAVWVEDNVPNALDGVSIGYRTFVMEKNHNLEFRDLTTVKFHEDWITLGSELVKILKTHGAQE